MTGSKHTKRGSAPLRSYKDHRTSGSHFGSHTTKFTMDRFILLLALVNIAIALPGDHYVMRSLPFNLDQFNDLFSMFDKRGAGACPANTGKSTLTEAEKKAFVAEHNSYRKKEGAKLPDMVWDESVADQAQKLADAQTTCKMEHKLMKCGDTRLGQNLAWDWSSAKQTGNMAASKVVKMWYDEKKDYDLKGKKCNAGKVCGHYTQVVWRGSTKVGCAARNCGQERLVICDYFPGGNWQGLGPHDEKNTF